MLWSRVLLSSANAKTLKSGSSIATNNVSLASILHIGRAVGVFVPEWERIRADRLQSSKTLPAQETDEGTFVYTQGAIHDVARDILSKGRLRVGDQDCCSHHIYHFVKACVWQNNDRSRGVIIDSFTQPAENAAFFVCDLRDVAKKVELWREFLPRVEPFYAIKACRDPVVLNGLNTLGVNFDCSNKGELSAVLNMGVSPSRIVYANTVKSLPDIEFAHQRGIRLMTFDSAEELAKVKNKGARLLLRIQADETGSQHSFNIKFGCTFSEAKNILQQALRMGCNVVGVSFHVGCAYQNTEIFAHTIERARAVFDVAASIGINMTLLDIGGGFPGGSRKRDFFRKVCESIRLATELHFPASSGVHIIAEPGQFFVTSCYALVVQVIGKRLREVVVDDICQPHQELFINESKDNCVSRNLYDYLDVNIWPLQEPLERPNNVLTTVWGCTCNPIDCIQAGKPLFEACVGEWLLMDNIGAYSLSRASGFSGLPFARVHYIAEQEDACIVRRILDASPMRSGYCQPESVLKEALLAHWRTEATANDSRVAPAAATALQC